MGHWFTYYYQRSIAALKVESAKNYLGWAIWLIEPLLMMMVFYLVFGVLLQRGGEGFAPFLLVGIMAWLWFAGTVGRCINSIYVSKQLITQIYVPKLMFPIVDITVIAVKQVAVFLLLALLLSLLGYVSLSWLWLPLVMAVQLLLVSAVGLVASAVVPFLPDVRFFIPPLLQMLMFCSGVFYSVESMPSSIREYFLFNPVANIIHQYRSVLLDNSSPDVMSLAVIALGSLIAIAITACLMRRYDRYYPRLVL